MITALLVIFLVICISMVSFVAVAYSSSAIGFGVVAESLTSLFSTAYFVLLFTTTFDSGQRLFYSSHLVQLSTFKQHSSLTYQNPSFFQDNGRAAAGCGFAVLRQTKDKCRKIKGRAAAGLSSFVFRCQSAKPKILQHYNNITFLGLQTMVEAVAANS